MGINNIKIALTKCADKKCDSCPFYDKNTTKEDCSKMLLTRALFGIYELEDSIIRQKNHKSFTK